MHLLAYNLIRSVIVRAAEAHGKRPRRASFKGALQTMTAFSESLRSAGPGERDRLMAVMLKSIAGNQVGDQPGRAEPRANQRRFKPQRYPNEPRRIARNRLLDNALWIIRVPFGAEPQSCGASAAIGSSRIRSR